MISLSERALGLLGFDAEFIDVVLGDLTEESVARVARDGVVRARGFRALAQPFSCAFWCAVL